MKQRIRGFAETKTHTHWRNRLSIIHLARIPEILQLGAYSLTVTDNVDPFVLFTWLRICDLITKNQQANQELNIERLKSKLH